MNALVDAMTTQLTTLSVRVAQITPETPEISAFELRSMDGNPLPSFEAGAHIDVHLPNGLVRQYSLCNPLTATESYEIAVLRDPQSRGGSSCMHELTAGQVLTISTPRNHFPLTTQEAEHHVLVAGGIGITPLLAMAHTLSQQGASFELHYCTRTPASCAFRVRLAESDFSDQVHFHHDQEPEGHKLDIAALLAGQPSQRAHLYVCGPSGFMDWVLAAGRQAGWAEARLHREYFSGVVVDTTDDGAFDVRIASTGTVLRVPADQPVSTVLLQHGIALSTSCEQGVCGTCVVRVLDGLPEHRDMYLTDEEREANNQFTPCCSRSKSACLVLDL